MKSPKKTFIARLKALRRKQGLSQNALAKHAKYYPNQRKGAGIFLNP